MAHTLGLTYKLDTFPTVFLIWKYENTVCNHCILLVGTSCMRILKNPYGLLTKATTVRGVTLTVSHLGSILNLAF